MKTGSLYKGNVAKPAYPENASTSEDGLISAELLRNFIYATSTGLISGGILSIDPGNLTFTVSSGRGVITLSGDDPKHYSIDWDEATGLTTPYRTTHSATWVFINWRNEFELMPSSVTPSPDDYRTKIFLGRVFHADLLNLTIAVIECMPMSDAIGQLRDFLDSFGTLNIEGNEYFPINNTLQIKKTAGKSFRIGCNYQNDTNNPHIATNPAVEPLSLRYHYRTSTAFATTNFTSLINPNIYDNNTSITAVPVNAWTTHRIYHSPTTNRSLIETPQITYPTLQIALNNFQNESHRSDKVVTDDTNLRCYLLVKQGATDLSDINQARFFTVTKQEIVSTTPTIITQTTSADSNFIHQQIIPSTTWPITHNLNKFPSVTVVDSGNTVVEGDVVYINENSLEIRFSSAFGGRAYIN